MQSNRTQIRASHVPAHTQWGVSILLLLLAGCSIGGSTPTNPVDPELALTSAQVVVGRDAVNGLTLPQGHGEGQSTRFEARLVGDEANVAEAIVWMQFDRPRGMGMGHHTGRIPLYDDGTHGDRVAGDGLYCYEDLAADYGCHGADAGSGEYHYEFFAEHPDGHETNHMLVTVTITDS